MGVGVVPATRVKAARPHSETDPQINKRCERQKVGLQQGHRSHARGARTSVRSVDAEGTGVAGESEKMCPNRKDIVRKKQRQDIDECVDGCENFRMIGV